MNPGALLIRTDIILITNRTFDSRYHIMPSRTDLDFSFKDNCYIGTALVINLTNEILPNHLIFGKIEDINGYRCMSITKNLSFELKKELQQNNFARETLPGENELQIPYLQINSLTAEKGSFYNEDLSFHQHAFKKVKELSRAGANMDPGLENPKPNDEILYDSAETYSEIATFKDEIIEPQKGIDCPTIIYSSPEEAIDLKSYPPEIKPYSILKTFS